MHDHDGEEILLGRGQLTWPRSERIRNRYGTVALADDPSTTPTCSSLRRPPAAPAA